MLNGRPKNGSLEIDWRSMALGKKYQRKTIGFGKYSKKDKTFEHEMHIRELCVASGALGCALWDGGVVLARWIYENPSIFKGQRVLELGSGCGLPGILCAHYAEHVTLTDYIDQVLQNLRYNIDLNCNADIESAPSIKDAKTGEEFCWRGDLRQNTTVGYLDWDAVAKSGEIGQVQEFDDSLSATIDQKQDDGRLSQKCTIQTEGRTFHVQDWFYCVTCYGDGDSSKGCCLGCSKACHLGHNVKFAENSRFRCDCYESEQCTLSNLEQSRGINIHIEPVDIIIGAELTYSLLSVDSLIAVVEHFLKPNGVFYEVLSEDRDGVSVFLKKIAEKGFLVNSTPVPDRFMGNYSTRQWSYQDKEKYRFYSFHKPLSEHSNME